MAAALLVVGGLCLLNLVLTFGIIRRLRLQADAIPGGHHAGEPELTLPVGSTVDDFTATTTIGAEVSRASLGAAGGALVGFFSPHCPSCLTHVPRFLDHVRSLPADRALAVVSGDATAAGELVSKLAPEARVVVEPHGGAITSAFGVVGSPAFVRIDPDHTIAATSLDVNVVADAVRA